MTLRQALAGDLHLDTLGSDSTHNHGGPAGCEKTSNLCVNQLAKKASRVRGVYLPSNLLALLTKAKTTFE